jgi:tetratricopeptide (TPR) repeat protein
MSKTQLKARGDFKLTAANSKTTAKKYDEALVLYEQAKALYKSAVVQEATSSDPVDLEDNIKENLSLLYKNWAAALILKSNTDEEIKEENLLQAITVLEEGEAEYKDAIKDHLHTAYYNLGLHYHKSNDFDQAIEFLGKAKVVKNDEMISYSLGLCHLAKGDIERGEAELKESIELAKAADSAALALNSFCKLIKSKIDQAEDGKDILEEAFEYLATLEQETQMENIESANMICSHLAQRQLIDGDNITEIVDLSKVINKNDGLVVQLTDAALHLNSIGKSEICVKMLLGIQNFAEDGSQIHDYLTSLWLGHHDPDKETEILGDDGYEYTIDDFNFA